MSKGEKRREIKKRNVDVFYRRERRTKKKRKSVSVMK